MPISHRHAHPQRDLMGTIGDIVDDVNPFKDAPEPNHDLKRDADTDAQGDDGPALVKKSPQKGKNGVPTAIREPTKTNNLGTQIAQATGKASKPTDNLGSDSTATRELTAPTQSNSSQGGSSDDSSSGGDSGSSAGVKAGIAFGVLGGLLIIGLIIYFIFNKTRSNKAGRNPENGEEKFTPAGGPPPPPMKDQGKAPRLSLRPVTQFFPGINDKRASKGAAATSMAPAGAAWAAGRRSPGPNPFERPSTSQSTHPSNPFGNQAERAPSPITEEHSMHTRSSPPTPDRNAKPVAAGRHSSVYTDGNNVDFTVPDPYRPASPAGTEFSMSSAAPGPAPYSNGAAAIAAAGGPQNTTVHRVQLDFKPSLEDEMELKPGDLVRLLHEYDDGWALCIKLDRSQQGVVPRTCLSTRPVKPRPPPSGSRGPPVNPRGPHSPSGRPMTPQDRPESPFRPGTATGPGPASPGFRPQSPMGRPMSPGRSQSPGPRYQGQPAGRPRAPSSASRHGPSPMNPSRPSPSSPGPAPGPAPGQAL